MLYNKAPIMWKSKMQKTTALSTAEAEYYSASTAGTEILYLRALLERLGIAQKEPTPVYEDNTACIEWGNNVIGGRERAKHIDIRKHFAHEVIRNGEMKLIKVSTTSQLAYILTKGLHLPVPSLCQRCSRSGQGLALLRDLCPQEGAVRYGYQSRVTSALKRGDSPAQWEAKARARHRLVSWPSESRDSDMGQEIRSGG
jgi:hypothetical protein